MAPTIAALGELALIERLQQRVGAPPPHVLVGIGDDAAVIEPERGAVEVVTTDCLVEGVHFRREWTSARAIGHKALAVSLSDLAAMGATPRASLLSLVLPPTLPLSDFDGIVEGFTALAEVSGAVLIGGNMTGSPGPVVVDVTAIGWVRRRRLLKRGTARAGDDLFVTGRLGAAAAGLAIRSAGVPLEKLDDSGRACVERYEQPDARWRCGSIVGRSGAATAAMDLSDGLAVAARAIALASGLGVTIDADAIPVHHSARVWAWRANQDPVIWALSGGEDYELAFAVPPRLRRRFLGAVSRSRDLEVTRVGQFTKDRGMRLGWGGRTEELPTGYRHF